MKPMQSQFSKYRYVDTISNRNKVARFVWNIIWYLLFKPTPRWCMNSWRIFLLRLFGARIGLHNKISPSCIIWAPWNLEIGDYSVLGEGVNCYSMDKICIGSKVAISQRSFLCTGSHDISSLLRPLITKPIKIHDHVWICAESYIGPGVEIGEGSVIGARSVVSKNIAEWNVVAGNPATFIKTRTLQS